MLPTSSPLGSACPPPPVVGPPPCCVQAPATSPTRVRRVTSGQMRLRVAVKFPPPSPSCCLGMRDSEPLSLPPPAGAGSARGEAPPVGVPRERRAGRGRLDVAQGLGRDIDAQLLVERQRGERRGPEPLHLGVDRSLVIPVGGPRRRRLEHVEPRVDGAGPARRGALCIRSILRGEREI